MTTNEDQSERGLNERIARLQQAVDNAPNVEAAAMTSELERLRGEIINLKAFAEHLKGCCENEKQQLAAANATAERYRLCTLKQDAQLAALVKAGDAMTIWLALPNNHADILKSDWQQAKQGVQAPAADAKGTK